MRGTLFDLPNVVAGAPVLLQASGVKARCEVVGGSFFDGVPRGADAYLLRAILHDWDDERSITILKSVRKAAAKDAVLLIVERVLPEKAEAGNAVDSYLLDLEMLVNTPGGRERSESEFREILNAAGFGPPRLIPTSTATSSARGAAGLDLRERGTVAARQKAAKERRIWDPKKMPSSTFPRIAYDFLGAQAKCCCLAQRP